MSNSKKIYYIGLSMAGTVSAGTYTAGSLIELDRWLSKWQEADENNKPISLKALYDAGPYKKGDSVQVDPSEFPDHEVKIAALTGTSGGGVGATLYMLGLATGRLDELVRGTWQDFDIKKMLNTDDLSSMDKNVYSILNVLPIEEVISKIKTIKWDHSSRLDKIRYIADTVELYQTLTSYEAIPYSIVPYNNTAAGIFNNHYDYIRFGISKSHITGGLDSSKPYRYELKVTNGQPLVLDAAWMKLVESTPATGAFPIGFRPRLVKRRRDEYDNKFFYLKYSSDSSTYEKITPNWTAGSSDIDMEYFDGGAFNREPHDLARASLLRLLNRTLTTPITRLPHQGKLACASVILIDPFPSDGDPLDPGTQVKGIPTLFKQIPLLLGALMDQGRFHTDWIEKTMDEEYYSRFLISPKRPKMGAGKEGYSLAGAPFSAFCGFIDDTFRMHDYKLGHYNTWKFLNDHFLVPLENETVTYCQKKPGEKPADYTKRLDKYKAIGWLDPTGKCQVIPRFEDQTSINRDLPVWPCIDASAWEDVRDMMLERAYVVYRNLANFPGFLEWAAWKGFVKSQVGVALDAMEETLIKAKLLKK